MNSSFNLSFIDFLSSTLTCFMALFILSFLNMNDPSKGNVIDKSEFIIEMEWADGSPNDIDLWVENPLGQQVWYSMKDTGLMTLDRDQKGDDQNIVSLENGEQIVDRKRREVVNIRTFIPGEYIVNAVYYSGNELAEKIKIKVRKLNPYTEVYEGEKILEGKGDEKTFVRFTVGDDGTVTSIDTISEKSLVEGHVLSTIIPGVNTPGGL